MSSDTQTCSGSYPVSPRNRVKRLHERGSYDRDTVHAILDTGLLCHVAYVIDGQPYCTPTLYWREDEVLYWHGSSASRMLRHLKAGTPASLTVSHLDGLVLARTGFNHSANYRSVMCFGNARLVEDQEEKSAALRAVVDRLYPGRSATLRPTTAQEAKATTVISMTIEEASAKVRAKGAGDNEGDYGQPVWAGVIPVKTVIGEADACPRLLPGIREPDDSAPYRPGRTLDEALVEAHRTYEAAAVRGAAVAAC